MRFFLFLKDATSPEVKPGANESEKTMALAGEPSAARKISLLVPNPFSQKTTPESVTSIVVTSVPRKRFCVLPRPSLTDIAFAKFP